MAGVWVTKTINFNGTNISMRMWCESADGTTGPFSFSPGTSDGTGTPPNGANINGQKSMSGSAPVVVASDQSPVATLVGVSASLNGATPSRINAAASTNATSLKASSGQVYSIDVYNSAAYSVYLKLYNKASAPTVGTDTPVMTIPIASGGGYSKTWQTGFPFSTGIAYAITKAQADSDTTAVVAGDLTGNIIWI